MGKKPRSFSIDAEIAESLASRDDINASGAVNTFLREYLSGGRGSEAAIEVRISQLDEEIAELEKQLGRKRRERERLENRMAERRAERDEVVKTVVNKIQANEFPKENLHSDNLAIQTWAGEAGVDAERFIDEVQARL